MTSRNPTCEVCRDRRCVDMNDSLYHLVINEVMAGYEHGWWEVTLRTDRGEVTGKKGQRFTDAMENAIKTALQKMDTL